MTKLTLVTNPNGCVACKMTEKLLKHNNTKYTVKHIKTLTQRDYLVDHGYAHFPVVEPSGKLDNKSFTGFRPDRLRAFGFIN